MMFEVGERLSMERELCRGRSEDEIKQNCNYSIKPGAVYEVVYVLDQPIKREDIPKLYSLVKDLESRLPEIGINYIGVSDDGKEIVFQIFDPPAIPVAVYVIVILVLTFIIMYFAVPRAAEAIVKVAEAIVPTPAQIPPELKPVVSTLFWAGAAVAVGGAGFYLLTKVFRKREKEK